MKLFANRLCCRVGGRPSKLKATTDGRRRYAREFRPFCHRQTLSVPCQNTVRSFIPRLLFSGHPAAVAREIAFFVVYPIQRVLRGRTWAHVLEERIEGIFPTRADRNAAASVAAVGRIIAIVATSNHSPPNSMFGTLAHPVFGMAQSSHFFAEAPTASRASVNQMTRSNDHGLSARAAAQPGDGFGFPSYRLQRCQSFELLPGEISKTHAATIPQKQIEPQEA